jgi:hypothetical protein
MFILNETEPHIFIPALTEPDPGRDSDFSLAEQELRKLQ